jgi:hypothetical protein
MDKTPKVVFRVAKLKSFGEIAAAGSHNLRTRPTPNAAPGGKFVQVVALDEPAHLAVQKKIGDQKIRSNAVLAVEAIISASPEYFRPDDPSRAGHWEKDRLDAWRAAVEPWISENFPHAVSVVLHLDEATPHYQVIDVPLDDKGKLNCRAKFGGTLDEWQTRAAAPVAHLGIERGIEGSAAKHERVKAYYGTVNAPAPEVPAVKTPKPVPLPPRTVAESLPFTTANAERDAAEAAQQQQLDQRNKEKRAQGTAIMQAWPDVSKRSAVLDLERRKREQAEATVAKLTEQKKVADQLRALPIDTVLRRVYGAELEQGSHARHASRKYLLPDGRKIGVSPGKAGADVWIEQGSEGKRGAINLVMHLDGLVYKDAVRLLAEHFDSSAVAAEHAGELVKRAAADIHEIAKGPVAAPAPDPTKWPRVRKWLHEVRGMPRKLIDKLHDMGLLYADSRANATFKREAGGAFQRGTGSQKFHRSIGGPECGPFIVPGNGKKVVLVEAPLDAIGVVAAHPGVVAIASGGDQLPPAKLGPWIPEGAEVLAGHDDDKRGNQVAKQAEEVFGAKRLKPSTKDWAQTVKNEPWRVDSRWDEPRDLEIEKNAPRPVLRPSLFDK